MKASNEIIRSNYNNFYFSSTDIHLILEELIKENMLEDYVKEITIELFTANCCGRYFPETKELYIHQRGIFSTMNHYITEKSQTIERIKMYNLLTLETILHEVRHAYQTKEASSNKKDSLHIIIKEGIELGSKIPNNLSIYEK